MSRPGVSPTIDTNPNIPIASNTLTSDKIQQGVRDELVNAHLDGRPVNMRNVTNSDLEPSVGSDRKIDGDGVTAKVNSDSFEQTNIAGEEYIPGQPMTEAQVAAIEVRIAMGNEVSGQELKDFNSGKEKRDARIKNEKQNSNTRSGKQAEIENIKRQRNQANVR